MKVLLRLTFPLLFLLLAGVASGQQRSSNCAPSVLPADLSDALKSQFPGWRIKTTDDLASYHQKLWAESKPKACPGIASGHFLNPTKQTFALLLVPDTPGKNGYKVVVFARSDGKPGVTPTVIEEAKDHSSARVVIYRVPPGLYKDPENTRRVRIRLDGIQVEEMEAAASLYFWRNGYFHYLLTSE